MHDVLLLCLRQILKTQRRTLLYLQAIWIEALTVVFIHDVGVYHEYLVEVDMFRLVVVLIEGAFIYVQGFLLVGLKGQSLFLSKSADLGVQAGLWTFVASMSSLSALIAYRCWQKRLAPGCNVSLFSTDVAQFYTISTLSPFLNTLLFPVSYHEDSFRFLLNKVSGVRGRVLVFLEELLEIP